MHLQLKTTECHNSLPTVATRLHPSPPHHHRGLLSLPVSGSVSDPAQFRNYNSPLCENNKPQTVGIKAIADEYNFIAVWPNGLDDTVVAGFDAFSWNAVGTVNSPGPLGDTCKWEQQGTPNGYPCHTSCQSTRGCRTDRRSSTCDCSTCKAPWGASGGKGGIQLRANGRREGGGAVLRA